MSGFSSALKLTDLNDFIQPSQACIKPVEASKKDEVTDEGDGGITINKSQGWKARAQKKAGDSVKLPEAAKPLNVTLGDCLACSGCITSAEAVLIAEQSHEKVLEVLEKKKKDPTTDLVIVLSLSLQSIASLAAKYRLSMQTAAEKIAGAFHSLGVDYVLDVALARHISLIEAAREFTTSRAESSEKKTLLSSTCPGFVCYAEKSQGSILVPMLSRVKSPQQIMGLLVKRRFHLLSGDSQVRKSPSSIYHITLMPCYDKKLEASRLDNRLGGDGADEVPEVDCVITPIEVEKLLEMCFLKLPDVAGRRLDLLYEKFYPTVEGDVVHGLRSHNGSGAGGYAENLFRFVASQMYGEQLLKSGPEALKKLSWKTLRNTDYLELKLFENGTTESSDTSEKALLSFAILNGFRNVQNLVSRVKRKTCSYDYVEVSACPKGCLNGGAQLRDIPVNPEVNSPGTIDPAVVAYEQVQRLYEQLPTDPSFGLEIPHLQLEQLHLANRELYEALELDNEMIEQMRTQFAVIEKTFNILNSNW